jgi:hypothetical protein
MRVRLTSGAGRRWGLVAAAGYARAGQHGDGALTFGPGHTVPGRGLNSVLNRFKNIQTVQMKFEFLQTLAGSKDTSPHSKKLK